MSKQSPKFDARACAQQLMREIERLQRESHDKNRQIRNLQLKNSELVIFAGMQGGKIMRLQDENQALRADNSILRDAVDEQALATVVSEPVVEPEPVVEQIQAEPVVEPEPVVEQIQAEPRSIEQVVSQAAEAGNITPVLAALLERGRAQGSVYENVMSVLSEVATATLKTQEYTDELTYLMLASREQDTQTVRGELNTLLTDCHGLGQALQDIQAVMKDIAFISARSQKRADEIKSWQDADREAGERLAAEIQSRKDEEKRLAAEIQSRKDEERAAQEATTRLTARLAKEAKKLEAQKKQAADQKAKADRLEQKRQEEEAGLRQRDQERLARAAQGKKKRVGNEFTQPFADLEEELRLAREQRVVDETPLHDFERALELSLKVNKATDLSLVSQDKSIQVAAQVVVRRAEKKLQQIADGQAKRSTKTGPTPEQQEAEARNLAWRLAELMGKKQEPAQPSEERMTAIREFLEMVAVVLTPIKGNPKHVFDLTEKKISNHAMVELYLMDRMGLTKDIELEHTNKGFRLTFSFPDCSQRHATRWTNLQTIVAWLDQDFFYEACCDMFTTEALADGEVKTGYQQDLTQEFTEIRTKVAFKRLELKPYGMVDMFGADTYTICTRSDTHGRIVTIPCSVIQLILWNRMGKIDMLASRV